MKKKIYSESEEIYKETNKIKKHIDDIKNAVIETKKYLWDIEKLLPSIKAFESKSGIGKLFEDTEKKEEYRKNKATYYEYESQITSLYAKIQWEITPYLRDYDFAYNHHLFSLQDILDDYEKIQKIFEDRMIVNKKLCDIFQKIEWKWTKK